MTMIGVLGETVAQPKGAAVQQSDQCGCGKTTTLVYIGYQEYVKRHRLIVSNFHTRFAGAQWGTQSWTQYMSAQEIFDKWWDPELKGALILITEMQSLLNSAARNGKLITYIEKCLQQRRKHHFDIVWDSQRLGSSDLRIREYTQFLYRPQKFHCEYSPEFKDTVPTTPCNVDNCDKNHLICVYQEKPLQTTNGVPDMRKMITPKFIIKAWKTGGLFDTEEPMQDTLKYNPEWEDKKSLWQGSDDD